MKKIKLLGAVALVTFAVVFAGCADGNTVNVNTGTDENKPTDYSSTIYADFYNYPAGKQNFSGTLTVTNQLTTDSVLIFDGTVEATNYIGTIPAGSSINVKLDSGKFHTIVGIMKSDYDEKEDLMQCGQS